MGKKRSSAPSSIDVGRLNGLRLPADKGGSRVFLRLIWLVRKAVPLRPDENCIAEMPRLLPVAKTLRYAVVPIGGKFTDRDTGGLKVMSYEL